MALSCGRFVQSDVSSCPDPNPGNSYTSEGWSVLNPSTALSNDYAQYQPDPSVPDTHPPSLGLQDTKVPQYAIDHPALDQTASSQHSNYYLVGRGGAGKPNRTYVPRVDSSPIERYLAERNDGTPHAWIARSPRQQPPMDELLDKLESLGLTNPPPWHDKSISDHPASQNDILCSSSGTVIKIERIEEISLKSETSIQKPVCTHDGLRGGGDEVIVTQSVRSDPNTYSSRPQNSYGDGDQRPPQNSRRTTSSLGASSLAPPNSRKRLLKTSGGDEETCDPFEGDEGGVERGNKRYSIRKPGRLYACPFYRNQPDDPIFASGGKHKTCSTEGIKTDKLKEHIRRKHTKPHQCPTCGLRGDKGVIKGHQNVHCVQKIGFEKVDPVTLAQDGQLGERRKLNWHQVFGILFPDRPALPEDDQWFDGKSADHRQRVEDAWKAYIERIFPQIEREFRDSPEYNQIVRPEGRSIKSDPPSPVIASEKLAEILAARSLNQHSRDHEANHVIPGQTACAPPDPMMVPRDLRGASARKSGSSFDSIGSSDPKPVTGHLHILSSSEKFQGLGGTAIPETFGMKSPRSDTIDPAFLSQSSYLMAAGRTNGSSASSYHQASNFQYGLRATQEGAREFSSPNDIPGPTPYVSTESAASERFHPRSFDRMQRDSATRKLHSTRDTAIDPEDEEARAWVKSLHFNKRTPPGGLSEWAQSEPDHRTRTSF